MARIVPYDFSKSITSQVAINGRNGNENRVRYDTTRRFGNHPSIYVDLQATEERCDLTWLFSPSNSKWLFTNGDEFWAGCVFWIDEWAFDSDLESLFDIHQTNFQKAPGECLSGPTPFHYGMSSGDLKSRFFRSPPNGGLAGTPCSEYPRYEFFKTSYQPFLRRWFDVVVHYKLSTTSSGFCECFLNSVQQKDRVWGANYYGNRDNGYWCKNGIYKTGWRNNNLPYNGPIRHRQINIGNVVIAEGNDLTLTQYRNILVAGGTTTFPPPAETPAGVYGWDFDKTISEQSLATARITYAEGVQHMSHRTILSTLAPAEGDRTEVTPRLYNNARINAKPGDEFWYGCAIMPAADWSSDPNATTVMQVQETGVETGPVPVDIKLTGNVWDVVGTQNGTTDLEFARNIPAQFGVWARWAIHLRLSTSADGLMEVFKDGQRVGVRTGANFFGTSGTGEGFYGKFGLLHRLWGSVTARKNIYCGSVIESINSTMDIALMESLLGATTPPPEPEPEPVVGPVNAGAMFNTVGYYADNFAGQTNALISGRSMDADPSGKGWLIHNPALPIRCSGADYAVAAGNQAEASVDMLSVNQQFDIQFTPQGNNEYAILLRSDATGANCYRVIARTTVNEFRIVRVKNGVASALKTITYTLGNITHRTRARIYTDGSKTVIEIYEKDAFVGFYEDTSTDQIVNTRAGIRHAIYDGVGGRFYFMRARALSRVDKLLI